MSSRWIECEDQFLVDNFGKKNIAWIALRLGKSEKGVRLRAMVKGVKSDNKRGAPIDPDSVKELLRKGMSTLSVAAELNCTEATVIRISKGRNIKTQRKKRDEERAKQEKPAQKVFSKAKVEQTATPSISTINRPVSLCVYRRADANFVSTHPDKKWGKNDTTKGYQLSNQYLKIKFKNSARIDRGPSFP